MDYSSLVLGADISHYQQRPDMDELLDDGVQYVIGKATERMGVDPDFEWNRNEAAKRNILFLPYPFLRPDDTDQTRKHFFDVVGKMPPCLDWEVPGVTAAIVDGWIDYTEDEIGRDGMAYYGKWPPATPSFKIRRWPRWYPQYPNNPMQTGPRLPAWDGASPVTDWSTEWLIWQYTGKGRLPGIVDQIDLNRLACPLDVFKTWVETGNWPLSGKPAVQVRVAVPLVPTERVLYLNCEGDDVRLLQRRLVSWGITVAVDGDFGKDTYNAVQLFQLNRRVAPVDGIAGPKTIAELNTNQ